MNSLTIVAVALLLLVGIAAAVGDAKQDKVKQETKLLEGTWKITAAEAGGRNVEPEKLGVEQVIFAGDRVLLKRQGKEVGNYAYTVDPAKKPKQMNWLEGKDRVAVPLIYEVDGDDLKLCRPTPTSVEFIRNRRPGGFVTKGQPMILLTGKREKK
jgi:uncharacterized protein (TIGR03067 family)